MTHRIESDFSDPLKYDEWYEQNRQVYEKELDFVKKMLDGESFVEVGAGTGRFGGALGAIALIDVSPNMAKYSAKLGYPSVLADAHKLPLRDSSVQSVLFAFSLSFMEDPKKAFEEALRVSKKSVLIVDIESKSSKNYSESLKNIYKNYDPNFMSKIDLSKLKYVRKTIKVTLDRFKITLVSYKVYKE